MCYLKQKLVNNDTLGALNWQKRDLEEKRHPKVPGEEAAIFANCSQSQQSGWNLGNLG